ncbi:unnamed protein product [Allacma fusca]|uniref:Uncharacterized protein n=1 Tax=Allacma fusca TaxID=39272 RepID=A0A8J2L0B7_9HEXA|nr:unnamed protein product [Allacma fusca]
MSGQKTFSSFCVVELSEDNSVEAIPTGWTDVKKNTCKFPDDTRKGITTLRSNTKSKPAKSWPEYEILKIHYTKDDFLKAKQKSIKLLYSSTVETGTENEGGSSKRKRKPREIFSPESVQPKGRSKKRVKRSPSSSDSEIHESGLQYNAEGLIPIFTEKELSGAKDIGHQGKSPSRVQAIDTLISPNQSKESTPASNLDSDDSSKILENISRRSVSIESNLNTSNINNYGQTLSRKNRLQKNWCIAVGGKTFQRATTRVLCKLFSHELALKTLFSGRGGKICFHKLKIASSILGAISSIEDFCCSESQVETACQIWLRVASDRCGGRARRGFKAAI